MRGVYLLVVLAFCIMPVAAVMVDSDVARTLSVKNEARVIVTYDGSLPFNSDKIIHAPEIDAFYGTLTRKEILDLSNNPAVTSIQSDWKLKVTRDEAWDIINADMLNNASSYNLTGAGQTICVLDTGVDYTHDEFGNCTEQAFQDGNCSMFMYGFDYVNNDEDPIDDDSHGTHVVGIAHKVAPDAKFVILKVCDEDGDCFVSDMITAVSFCNAWRSVYNISVISMSIGDEGEWSDDDCFPSDSLTQIINYAADNGIFVAVASGNEGYEGGINYPACARGAVSVGATDDYDSITYFTNTYSTLDLLAPGQSINSTVLDDDYGRKSGTSMATPFVSGSAALLLQYEPLPPQELLYRLQSGGQIVQEWARIDLNKSIFSGHSCFLDDGCPEDIWSGDPYCQDGDAWQTKTTYTCDSGECVNSTQPELLTECTNGCQDGACLSVRSTGGGGGGSFQENIQNVEIEANDAWAQGQEIQVKVRVLGSAGPVAVQKVVLKLMLNDTEVESWDTVMAEPGFYSASIKPETGLGSYILVAQAHDTYQVKTAQKAVEIVSLRKILTVQSVAQTPGKTWSLWGWFKSMLWTGEKFP